MAWKANMDTLSTKLLYIVSRNVLFLGIGHVKVVSLCHTCGKQQKYTMPIFFVFSVFGTEETTNTQATQVSW